MQINLIEDRNKWEQLLDQFSKANFLQSFAWKTFQESLGKSVFALQIINNSQTLGLALIVSEKARRGNYLTIAGGPLINWNDKKTSEVISALIKRVKEIAKEEHAIFLRLRPQALDNENLRNFFKKQGFYPSPMHLTADLTLQLNLNQSEDELLKQMHKSTRYEVRKAKKLKIKTKISQNPEEVREFYNEQLAVAKRHNFIPFAYDFLYQQFLAFLETDNVALIHSYLGDQLLASAFIIFYRHEAVYHYGISTEKNARLPGSYACQWAAILEAKRRGQTIYNFWGIAPERQEKHRFAGVGRFKRGFGGEEVSYLPAQDYPLSLLYWGIRGFEGIRKRMRGL